MRRILPAVFALASVALVAAPAFAQDVAAAETLFNKGLADLEAGRLETACPAIGESYRLDPRPGTLFTLAECHAKAGKTASAVARYQDYLELFARLPPEARAKQRGREGIAAAQKAALTPRVPHLTLLLAADAPPGTIVKRDEVVLGGPSLGVPLPVDPGEHLVTATAPNGAPTTERITLGAGEKKTVTLAPRPGAVGPIADGGTSAAPAPPSARRSAGLVIGGVGVAGLIVGGITGGMTLGKKSTIEADCKLDTKHCHTEAGKSAAESAQTTGMISTIGFIVGGVGLVGGAVLFFTAPKTADARVVGLSLDAGPGAASLHLGGSF